MAMKTLTGLVLMILVAGAVPALADHPGSATRADLRQLRNEVDRLDDSLVLVDAGHPRAAEFRRRENDLRDRLVRLRGQVQRHEQSPDRGLMATKTEVDALQQDIVALRRDIDSSSRGSARDLGDVRVPDGTEIQIRLDQSLSSRTARPEDRVVATVAESVRAEGTVAIPAGTEVRGIVRTVEPAQRPSRGASVELAFDTLMIDGRRVDIQSRVVSIDEGGIDKKRAGLGAVLGGVLGAVLDGKQGAIIGAVLGGGGAVVATRGDDVELPAGTVLTLRLDRPLNVALR
jgi:hypothetical protein